MNKISSITDIVQKYIPHMQFINKHYMNIWNFYHSIGIDKNTKFININNNIQIGGSNILTEEIL